MSIAIANTQNNLGMRTLGASDLRRIRRGPAEPGPRAAENPVVLGAIAMPMIAEVGRDQGYPISDMIRVPGVFRTNPFPTTPITGNPVPAIYTNPIPAPPTLNPNGTASQAPTGVILNAAQPINQQIAPSVATTVQPATNPTAVATVAPASQPGYVVITSGGGTTGNPVPASPDYFAEIQQWLSASSLIPNVPNWMPVAGVALLFAFLHGGRRR